jgi:hypothetical protein
VKRAMYVVMVLVVLALPGMGQAQERSGNDTLPEYNLWLPMMGKAGCPYEVTEMMYAPYLHVLYGYRPGVLAYNPDIPYEEIPLLGEAIVATSSDLTQGARYYQLYQNSGYGGYPIGIHTVIEEDLGQTYYWKARFICNGGPGEWSPIDRFLAD